MENSKQTDQNLRTLHPSLEDKLRYARSQEVSSLVQRTIIEESSFTVYPNCVSFKPSVYKKEKSVAPTRRRSKISGFSKRSRFRLFTTLAKIKNHLKNKPFFVTLTYHFGFKTVDKTTKDDLHRFLVSLRDFDPSVEFIWRIDLQKRSAPHYHLLIFPSTNKKIPDRGKYLIRISSLWHSIADPNSKVHQEYGCKVVEIDSYRKACAYMSKYIAKLPAGAVDIIQGKHWGNSRNLPVKVYKVISGCAYNGLEIIELLRKWLLTNGKGQYASDIHFNTERPQIVFIDAKTFFEVIGYDTSNMCFDNL